MLVRYFIELPAALDELSDALVEGPGAWVPGLVREATSRGERLLTEVGFGDRIRIAKEVEIQIGQPRRLGATLYVPLSWKATGPSGLFPVLDGDLELTSFGERRTQVAISGRYTPPLDGLGHMADRAILHRVAESTVKDFVDHLGARLLLLRS